MWEKVSYKRCKMVCFGLIRANGIHRKQPEFKLAREVQVANVLSIFLFLSRVL